MILTSTNRQPTLFSRRSCIHAICWF